MATPVVYLDTQDFSKFADLERGVGDQSLAPIYKYLLDLSNRGEIQICYSMAIISELLQYENAGREITMSKAKVVEKLCGQNCFRYVLEVLSRQYTMLARTGSALDTDANSVEYGPVSKLGKWYPNIAGILEGFRPGFEKNLDNTLKTEHGLTRNARRQFRKKLRKKGEIQELLTKTTPEAIRQEMITQYPGFEKIINENMLLKYYYGQVSKEEIEKETFSAVSLPTRFVTWYFERSEGEKTLPYWMKGFGESIFETMKQLQQGLKKTSEEIPNELVDSLMVENIEIGVRQMRENLYMRFLDIVEHNLRRKGLNSKDLRLLKRNPIPNRMLFFAVIGNVFNLYMEGNLGIKKFARKVKLSDGGDIVHSIYLPYCDIWRSDSYFADLVRPLGEEYGTNVVSKIEQLPDAIKKSIDMVSAQNS